jgi:hypothetical protein
LETLAEVRLLAKKATSSGELVEQRLGVDKVGVSSGASRPRAREWDSAQLVESLGRPARLARIEHVDGAEVLGEYVADAGVPIVDHELHAIGATALIAMAIKRRLRT